MELTTQLADFLKDQSIQIAVVFAVVWILHGLLRNRTAHIRYLLWLLVALKCMTPPLMIFSVPVLPTPAVGYQPAIPDTPQPANIAAVAVPVPPHISTEAQSSLNPHPSSIDQPQSPIEMRPSPIHKTHILLFIYAAVGAFYFLWAIVKSVLLQRRLAALRRPLPEPMAAQIAELARLWHRPAPFTVWLAESISQPFVWGLWRGAIYLPARLQSIQTDRQKAVVMHEMAHVVRFDALVNGLQILVQGLFWFHPLVWIANRFIRTEREKCCDEIAVARLGAAPKEYGSAIIDTLLQEYQAGLAIPTLAVAGPVKNIEDRIKTLMRPNKRFYTRPTAIATLAILALAALIVPTTIALTHKVTPPDYSLSGSVVDANDNPIAGAIVFDDGYGPQPYQKGITDADGKFEYKSWNEEHNIAAKAEGYYPQNMTFTTAPFDNSKRLNFKLDKIAAAENTTLKNIMNPTFNSNTTNSELTTTNFTATLPNGVTVELLGLCEHPSEGKRWWQPDGTPAEPLFNRVDTMWNEDFRNYVFSVKIKGIPSSELGLIHWRSSGADHISTTSAYLDNINVYHNNICAAAGTFPPDTASTTVQIGLACRQWQTVCSGSHRGYYKAGDDTFLVGEPLLRRNNGQYICIGITHTINNKDREFRVIAIDKEGKIHLSAEHGSSGMGDLFHKDAVFPNLAYGQLKEYQFQTRPYEWITFKNVSLRPGVKTEVKIEAEEPEVGNQAAEAKPEVPLDQKSIQTVTFMKDMPLTDALRMLSKTYKVNIVPSQEVANSRSIIGVTHLYDVNFEQILQAVCGTTCTYEIKDDFIYVYTHEEYKALRPDVKTSVKIETEQPAASIQPLVEMKTPDPNAPSVPVTVRLVLQGKTVSGYPQVALADNTGAALYAKTSETLVPLARKIAKDTWDQSLEKGRKYVIGWITNEKWFSNNYEMFGFISPPFIAQEGLEVSFSPGLPATFEYDVSELPKSIWPKEVHLLKKYYTNGKLTYLNCGLIGKVSDSGKYFITDFATGDYQIHALTDDFTRIFPNPILEDFRDVTLNSGENYFTAEKPYMDTTVEPSDITITGKLVDQNDLSFPSKKIYLVLLDPPMPRPGCMNFKYFYPKQVTDAQGHFTFVGVNPKYYYQVEYWDNGSRKSCHSLSPEDLKKETQIVLYTYKSTVSSCKKETVSQKTEDKIQAAEGTAAMQ